MRQNARDTVRPRATRQNARDTVRLRELEMVIVNTRRRLQEAQRRAAELRSRMRANSNGPLMRVMRRNQADTSLIRRLARLQRERGRARPPTRGARLAAVPEF